MPNGRPLMRRGTGAVVVVAVLGLVCAGVAAYHGNAQRNAGTVPAAALLFGGGSSGGLATGNTATPTQRTQVRVTHVPIIDPRTPMPHADFGACSNCHLMQGGPPAGSQPKSVLGHVLEGVSQKLFKVGPTIVAGVARPHPPAGRCIKCHDMLVTVNVDGSMFRGQ